MDVVTDRWSSDGRSPLARLDRWLRGPQVCKIAGITYRQLDYWARTGVLVPAQPAYGSGTQRRYSSHQARVAMVLGLLSRLGARRAALTGAARALEDEPVERWLPLLFVWPDGEATLGSSMAAEQFRAAWVVSLDACRQWLSTREEPGEAVVV